MPRKKTTGRKDRIKCPIPDDLIPIFDEAKAIRRWLGKIKALVAGFVHIKRFFKTGWIDETEVMLGFKLILDRIELNLPYRVCPSCTRLNQCSRCGGRGWMTASQSLKCRHEIQKQRTSVRDTSPTESSSGSSNSQLQMKFASSIVPPDGSTSSMSEQCGG